MILTLIEYKDNAPTEACRQMLTFARGLEAESGEGLVGLVIGATDGIALTAELGSYGVVRVIKADDARLTAYAPVAWAKVLSQVIAETRPSAVLASGTERGNEIMAHLAAMLDLPLATNCSAVSAEDPAQITRLRWGSSLLEKARMHGELRLMTIGQHVVEAQLLPTANEPAEEDFSPTLADEDITVRLVRKEKDEAEGITLKTASIVVGGGRGVGSPEAYALLEELAGEIGAAVGCTRVATNNGWRPHSDQVGLTGTRISPDLYIACGISGAIQHLVGCKGAKNILVINKDPEAAFFSKADYGIVGDLHEIIPAITEEVRKAKA